MKYLKFAKYIGMSVVTLSLLYSCKKIKTDEPIGDTGQQIIRIMKYGSKEAAPFSASALSLDLSLATYDFSCVLEYSSSQVPTSDVTVTLGNDAAALAAFNAAQPANGIIYLPMSNTQYSFPKTTTVIRAGQAISEPFVVRLYPNQLDASKSYMLPLAITGISGAPANVVKAPASSIAYLHVIGNPIAGNYNNVGTRYNYTGNATAGWNGLPPFPGGYTTAACGTPKTISAISPTLATTYYANLGAGTDRDYYFTYDPTVSLTNVGVTFTPSFEAGISNIIVSQHTYDPVLKQLHILSGYNNLPGGAGSDRIVEETMTKQ